MFSLHVCFLPPLVFSNIEEIGKEKDFHSFLFVHEIILSSSLCPHFEQSEPLLSVNELELNSRDCKLQNPSEPGREQKSSKPGVK